MAYSIRAECPECGRAMRVRTNRRDRSQFLGCTGYPNCRYSEEYEPQAQALARQIAELETHLTRAIQSGGRRRTTDIDAELKRMIFRFHPDRVGETVPAHDVAVALNELRSGVAT